MSIAVSDVLHNQTSEPIKQERLSCSRSSHLFVCLSTVISNLILYAYVGTSSISAGNEPFLRTDYLYISITIPYISIMHNINQRIILITMMMMMIAVRRRQIWRRILLEHYGPASTAAAAAAAARYHTPRRTGGRHSSKGVSFAKLILSEKVFPAH